MNAIMNRNVSLLVSCGIFLDSKIDKYEDLTIRKVSDLIHVKHKILFH